MLSQLQIQGVHYTLSESTIEFIREKLSKIDYMEKSIADGIFRIIRDNDLYTAEVDIHFTNKTKIHMQTTDKLLYPAIENLVHKLKHKVSETHKKITSHQAPHQPSVHHSEGHTAINSEDAE